MKCPDCGGPMWDNRGDKKNPRSPDYKCKDKNCGKAVWEEKKAAKPDTPTGNGGYSLDDLGNLYARCYQMAKQVVGDTDTVAAAATLFIGAQRERLHAARPRPKPKPESFDDFPAALRVEHDDDLPI